MENLHFDWDKTYIETRSPYEGWTVYANNIFFVGNNKDIPSIALYNPVNRVNKIMNVSRFILDIKLGKKTTAKDDGDLVYLDGNKNNYLDPNNISIRPRAKSEMKVGLPPYNNVYINFRHGEQNGREAVGLHDIKTKKFVGYISAERYWLSVKLGKKITKFEGKVGHYDGNVHNNDIDNLYLIDGKCSFGEGIYKDYKIRKSFNKPRHRWMVTLYKRDENTGFWNRVEGKAYSRYLMEVKLGRILPKDIEVDHINGNRLDDRIENLQLVTPEENKFKAVYTGENRTSMAVEVEIRCRNCGKLHRIREYKYNSFLHGKRLYSVTFCSAECRHEYIKTHNIVKDEACNLKPDIVKIVNVPTLTQEFIDRTPIDVRERVMKTCKKAEEHTIGFGLGYYYFPQQLTYFMQQMYSIPPVLQTNTENLKKEYVFNSVPVTPFDV